MKHSTGEDLCLVNGRIYTQDRSRPTATAALIRGGRFVTVGSDEEVRSAAGQGTRTVDLAGATALPGFTDAHVHYYDWALGLRRVALGKAANLAEVRAAVAAAAREAAPGRWIVGQGWNETRLAEGRLPSGADLDAAAPDYPVMIYRNDMHLAVANTAALRAAGIGPGTTNPAGGVIDRDAAGRPTGVLRDLAMNVVSDVMPPPTDNELAACFRQGFPILHRLGITGLHDFRVMGGYEGAAAFRAWQRLDLAGELALRAWMNIPGESLREAVKLGLQTGFGSDRLRIGHVKFFVDGSQGARTAWMAEPYEDGGTGIVLAPMAEIAEALVLADRAGLALAIHAIGDRANRELIDVFEEHLPQARPAETAGKAPDQAAGRPPRAPQRIEHLQMIQPRDVARLAKISSLGVMGSVQPAQVPDDITMVERSVGPRAGWAYPFRGLLDAGVGLAFGSDCPVADPNPLLGIYAAVTRQRADGTPAGGWHPEQRVSIAEAVAAYTVGNARVTGREAGQGSVTPGKSADLVVLDRNIYAGPPEDLLRTRVVMTILDGEIVYER
jgi:predicted amidohydrolase YtcJ